MIESKIPEFGEYVTIEQKRYGGPNEMYKYKVVGDLHSNTYVNVPVQSPEEEETHMDVKHVVACICCGVDETKVSKFKIEDVKV